MGKWQKNQGAGGEGKGGKGEVLGTELERGDIVCAFIIMSDSTAMYN